jgi:carbamoyltransferase
MSYIIGISAYYHDSSACLFEDDKLIFACEEEKFSGIKHDNSFPINVINYIFDNYNLTKRNIECVCYYENPILRLKRKKSFFKSIQNIIKVWFNLKKISNKIHYTKHHLSHMMYSYLSSNFDKSVIVSVDGVGETETLSIGYGFNGKVIQIKTTEYPHSVGLFYSAMTAFLGFKPNEGEYKVMGLASYGNSNTYYDKVKNLLLYDNGGVLCDMNYFNWNKSSTLMFNHKLEEYLNMDCRLPDTKIENKHKDLAAAIQRVYEEVFFSIISYAKNISRYDRICLGGGCAYNGSANGKIVENGIYKHIWIPPAPSDAGSSIGSCLDYLTNKLKLNVRISSNPFLGPSFTEGEIFNVINKTNSITYSRKNNNILLEEIAKKLNDGFVVGWFRDRIEFGARALGNRSILANPTLPNIKDRINAVIKKREGFRPFAPMVCFDRQSKYFESSEFIPYMNQVVKVKDEYKDKLLAVTHVDGTARVQSVTPYNSIYQLLEKFEKVSGYPILLNTSFNIKDKTMVLTPQDAMNTFLNTDMDILVMGNYIIKKNK